MSLQCSSIRLLHSRDFRATLTCRGLELWVQAATHTQDLALQLISLQVSRRDKSSLCNRHCASTTNQCSYSAWRETRSVKLYHTRHPGIHLCWFLYMATCSGFYLCLLQAPARQCQRLHDHEPQACISHLTITPFRCNNLT